MPKNRSKYDEHFEMNHETQKAKCKICEKLLTKNCFGMKRHLRVKHNIIMDENVEEEDTEIQSPNKKAKIVEPIEDQICREVAKNGASFR